MAQGTLENEAQAGFRYPGRGGEAVFCENSWMLVVTQRYGCLSTMKERQAFETERGSCYVVQQLVDLVVGIRFQARNK